MATQRICFAQVSDVHLMPETGCRCWWMSDSPRHQLEAAVAHLNQVPDLHFVVFTGDLVDQADPESFELFQEILAQLRVPYYLSLGNHDVDTLRRKGRFDREQFIRWCQSQFPLFPAPTGYVDYSLSPLPGIRLIALDASLGPFPLPQGVLRPSQLRWLGEHLQAVSEEWLILLIHQPPFIAPTQVDAVVFRNYRLHREPAAALHALLASHGRVVAVLSGHLHVPKVQVRDGIPYLTAPPLVGPVSALRLFEVDLNPRRGILRYHWVYPLDPGPRPLWHGLVMGTRRDRWGQIPLRAGGARSTLPAAAAQ
ncbi:metallophosphoesterase [Synechococcus sp. H60.2]|uniref:metallophosphoesterase family protein n=1 Tax=Synechococcus sp. H60.2 TaxID=2964518 RepID=UPI0039C41E6A